ncbi:Crotonobetainyl-CoA:carnitine CoA-transferase CaiB [Kosakonia radicincitans]|uniref:CaiB/BaiF CoA transferase family protein n=1 Tax=Kosakonia radicincitans TaxID=283686 RepID=UPI0009A6BB87|nr:CoA transferase [Kosakonia radicincitans]SKC15824.1 Crotonobetainyl-CoA:carnitine CoA-transferase CaiB [Kosakonia radicincitans]
MSEAIKPLSGVRVLDLSRVLAGPWCASLLNDLGAEVIKIEMPGSGDDSRAFTPHINGESSYFMQLNHGKKSVTLDLKSPQGLAILKDLVACSDVLVENFRPGVTQRLGIDYATLQAINPRLVYVSISGFGQQGSLAHKAAYDHIIQAIGGIMQVTGWANGEPTRVGDAIGDVVAGLYGSWAVLAALLQRGITGKGQHLDVSMLDTMVTLQMVSLTQWIGGQPSAGRLGNAHPISAPMDSYRAQDGHIVIAVANDKLFRQLASAMGNPALVDDPRFASDPQRLAHQQPLREDIERWLADKSVSDAQALLDSAGVPASPVLRLDQILDSDYAHERELVKQIQHPRAGSISIVPQPVKMSGAPGEPALIPPVLGEHTLTVLREVLGMDEATLAQLQTQGVI